MKKKNGYTGKLFEGETLGKCIVHWISDRQWDPISSMELARKNQPWEDPSDPDLRVANDLHASVAIAMGLVDWEELCLFTSIGTPLDSFHGIDGWFEFRGRVLTMDVTTNEQKDSYKADMIIHPRDIEDDNLKDTARLMANILAA